MTQHTNRSDTNKKTDRDSSNAKKYDGDQNAHKAEPPKRSDGLATKVDEARGAVSNDIKALGEKLNVSHLKDEATNAIVDAKDAMVDKLVDVKDSAVEKLSDAKNATVETLSDAKDAAVEMAHDAGEQVKELGSVTLDFARANAMPLALIGIGAGWLVSSLLERSSSNATGPNARTDRAKRARISARPRSRAVDRDERTPDDERDLHPGRISGSAADIAAIAKNKGQQLTEKAKRGAASVKAGVKRAGTASLEYADGNPLAIAAVSVAAGVGIGMLLPSTSYENRWFGARRDQLFGEARETAQGLGNVVRDTVQETSEALR
jgi:ElaB/YqjD/DUF883 family membrane-anchored ribosome-binding protein